MEKFKLKEQTSELKSEKDKYVQKMKYCIISNHRLQQNKDMLWLFTLDSHT